MKSRQEIKAYAKLRHRFNYWPGVLTLLVGGLVIGLTSVISIAQILLTGPLLIGLKSVFIRSNMQKLGPGTVGSVFSTAFNGYGRKLGGYLWQALWILIWGLIPVVVCTIGVICCIVVNLFAGYGHPGYLAIAVILTVIMTIAASVPAIIKGFSYAMQIYILADCPNVGATDSLKLSMKLMEGHKWQLFVFELSFIGWQLLSGLTLGLLDIFFVGPYKATAEATWYLELRQDALNKGIITPAMLNGQGIA